MNSDSALMVGSYNCRGLRATTWSFISDIMNNCDILCVQEHWLFEADLDYLTGPAGSFNFTGVSGMNPGTPLTGRRFGG